VPHAMTHTPIIKLVTIALMSPTPWFLVASKTASIGSTMTPRIRTSTSCIGAHGEIPE